MKNIKLLILFLLIGTSSTFGQTSLKDCNVVFDKNLKAKFNSYNRQEFRQFLYSYLLANHEKREILKKKASGSMGMRAIIKAIPIDFNLTRDNINNKKFLQNLKSIVEKRGYVTDEETNLFIGEFFQEPIFQSYQVCLRVTERVLLNESGVFATIEGDINDSFIVKLKFTNKYGLEKINIKKAVFDGAIIKHGLSLSRGTVIKNNQTIYQHLKRIQNLPLNISISFEEGISGISKTYSIEKDSEHSKKVPIGTIIISTLDYQSFLDVNNDKQRNFDIKKSTWSPCDGRNVTGSKYGSKRVHVPDLRGVFIRGINNMNVAGSAPLNSAQLNPENKLAGEFQKMQIEKHRHSYINKLTSEPIHGLARSCSCAGAHGAIRPEWMCPGTLNRNGGETRPKNRTVYYYIEIN